MGYLKELPLEEIIQIHLCSPGIKHNGVAWDAHDIPDTFSVQEALRVGGDCDCEFLTVEYYRDADKLIDCMKRIRLIDSKEN